MFPASYFAPTYYAPTYWPKVGAPPPPMATEGRNSRAVSVRRSRARRARVLWPLIFFLLPWL